MISRAEYEARQARFRSVLAAEGFDGALVVSRGGSTLDRYAQVLYLTGHYQSYSYLPDAPSLFSGRSHAAVVLDASGRIALCVSVPEFDASALAVDDVRVSDDFAGTVASAFQDFALTAARVALVGADVLPLRIWRDLRARVSAAEFQDADELLMALRLRKSPAEQDAIRRAAAVHRQGMTAVLNAIRPGQRESDLVGTFADVVMREGAGLYFTSLSSGAATRRWASAASPGFSPQVGIG
jgi:Xaa-Pro aminopeptidase